LEAQEAREARETAEVQEAQEAREAQEDREAPETRDLFVFQLGSIISSLLWYMLGLNVFARSVTKKLIH
jgi:hypothetical protein